MKEFCGFEGERNSSKYNLEAKNVCVIQGMKFYEKKDRRWKMWT